MATSSFGFWETTVALAAAFNVPYPTAQSWTNRGYIPSARDWDRLKLIEEITGRELTSTEKLDHLQAFNDERNPTKVEAA